MLLLKNTAAMKYLKKLTVIFFLIIFFLGGGIGWGPKGPRKGRRVYDRYNNFTQSCASLEYKRVNKKSKYSPL